MHNGKTLHSCCCRTSLLYDHHRRGAVILSAPCNKPGWAHTSHCQQRPEAQLLRWHAHLCQLGLVHVDEVIVRLGHLCHVVLQRSDEAVLGRQQFFQLLVYLQCVP